MEDRPIDMWSEALRHSQIIFSNFLGALLGTENNDTTLVASDTNWKEDELDQREAITTRSPFLIVKISAWIADFAKACLVK